MKSNQKLIEDCKTNGIKMAPIGGIEQTHYSDAQVNVFMDLAREDERNKLKSSQPSEVVVLSDEEIKLYRDALSNILSVAASMITHIISEEISEYYLPKSTPITAKNKIIKEAVKWNETNKSRANKLKSSWDILNKYFYKQPNQSPPPTK